ncbi:MAG TPA: hypothetical protein VKZ53_13030 [Candidatus Angelobacter sp.]|nr:hypothetical protein [Candidatus Angelobacter sp.]
MPPAGIIVLAAAIGATGYGVKKTAHAVNQHVIQPVAHVLHIHHAKKPLAVKEGK